VHSGTRQRKVRAKGGEEWLADVTGVGGKFPKRKRETGVHSREGARSTNQKADVEQHEGGMALY